MLSCTSFIAAVPTLEDEEEDSMARSIIALSSMESVCSSLATGDFTRRGLIQGTAVTRVQHLIVFVYTRYCIVSTLYQCCYRQPANVISMLRDQPRRN